jgi:hypothetical protein
MGVYSRRVWIQEMWDFIYLQCGDDDDDDDDEWSWTLVGQCGRETKCACEQRPGNLTGYLRLQCDSDPSRYKKPVFHPVPVKHGHITLLRVAYMTSATICHHKI